MAAQQAQTQEKTALELFKNHWQKIVDKGPSKQDIGRGIVAALHDIHRRLIEEPWFGRTIHDVVSYYNNRGDQNDRNSPGADQQDAKDNNQNQGSEKKNGAAKEGTPSAKDQEPAQDHSPDTLSWREQSKESEQQEVKQREYSRGMER